MRTHPLHHYDTGIKDSEEKYIKKALAITAMSLLAGVDTSTLMVESVYGTCGGACREGAWYVCSVGHPTDPVGHGQLWYMYL